MLFFFFKLAFVDVPLIVLMFENFESTQTLNVLTGLMKKKLFSSAYRLYIYIHLLLFLIGFCSFKDQKPAVYYSYRITSIIEYIQLKDVGQVNKLF